MVRKWTLGLLWKWNQSRNEGFGMWGTKMKTTPNFKVSKCTLVLASWLGRCGRVSNVAIWSRIPHCLVWVIWRERNAWIFEGRMIGAWLKILFFNTLFEWINDSGVFVFCFIWFTWLLYFSCLILCSCCVPSWLINFLTYQKEEVYFSLSFTPTN